jgi:hypothetical protein
MDRDDRAYFLRRAVEERARASIARDKSAAIVHFQLAHEYERRANALAHTASPSSTDNDLPAQ